MNLKEHVWLFQSGLPKELCEKIVKLGLSRKSKMATTGTERGMDLKDIKGSKLKKLKKIRNSNIVFMSDEWLYQAIHPFIHTANKNAGWNFDWDYSEACQFTIYKKQQHYGWHTDSFSEPYNDPSNLNIHNKIRKLSVTISLSDPKDYKGGELEFDLRNREDGKNNVLKFEKPLPQGSVVVFPSFVFHRVKPVTKGTRYSLVIWNLGYPFK